MTSDMPGFIRLLAPSLAMMICVCDLSAAGSSSRLQQNTGLKIVVIAGEEAVNIIQQKTAVTPIVEVRDRNDQPVAGAVVNFAIRSGRASFGGARTLTVTTDVVGRAVAGGLTPTGSGALQISASAAFQGQTAAVTIAQTNVMTAAQAAAIGSGGAGGGGGAAGTGGAAGGGGGGGGLSGLTVGLIAGGVGAGALVAVNARDNGSGGTSSAGNSPFQSTLYSLTFTPGVATVYQCPIVATVQNPGQGAGPTSTSFGTQSDGSISAPLTVGVSGSPGTFVATISGRITATDITATIACIGGGGPTGTLNATGTTAQYQGTWTFGSLSGTLNVVPQ